MPEIPDHESCSWCSNELLLSRVFCFITQGYRYILGYGSGEHSIFNCDERCRESRQRDQGVGARRGAWLSIHSICRSTRRHSTDNRARRFADTTSAPKWLQNSSFTPGSFACRTARRFRSTITEPKPEVSFWKRFAHKKRKMGANRLTQAGAVR